MLFFCEERLSSENSVVRLYGYSTLCQVVVCICGEPRAELVSDCVID